MKNNLISNVILQEKFLNIEFLRIVAIAAILMLHIFHTGMGWHSLNWKIPLYEKMFGLTGNGQKGVDFFFMLSGLFFYLGILATNYSVKWIYFLKKKIVRMWPVMAFTVLLAFVFSLFDMIDFKYWDNFYSLLFLNGTSLHRMSSNIGISWYCSAMMFHFILFLYLFKNYNSKTVWLIIALGIYTLYTIILQAKGFKINGNWQTFGYVFNVGMMCAWGGIGIGMFIALWYQTYRDKICNYTPSMISKIAISVLEFVCLYFMIHNLMLNKFRHFDQFIFIIDFAAVIILFIARKGFVSQMLNLKIWSFFSKYVYSVFITHQFTVSILKNCFWKVHKDWILAHPVENIVLTFGLILLLGILTYHLVEKPCVDYMKRKKS